MNRSVNGVRDAWYSSGRVVASAPHGPETGFEEKSIPPRKLAGQMNGIRLTAQVAGSLSAVIACEILCSYFFADHQVSFAAS